MMSTCALQYNMHWSYCFTDAIMTKQIACQFSHLKNVAQ